MQIESTDTLEIDTTEERRELTFERRYFVRGALNQAVLCFAEDGADDGYELHYFPSSGQAVAVSPEDEECRVEPSPDETERDVVRVVLQRR